MKNVLFLLAFFSVICFSCKDDDAPETTDYKVEIEINNPVENSSYGAFENIPIEVVYTRGTDELIHHVKIELIDVNGNVVKTILEEHVHQPESYSYIDDVGISIGDTGTYKVRASSHDMDGNHADPVEVTITAQ